MTKNQFKPDYPKTPCDAVKMMKDMHDEDLDTKTDFLDGYRMGLRIGMQFFETVEKNKAL